MKNIKIERLRTLERFCLVVKRGDTMVDKFTKSDLRDRMVVEIRKGEKYILVGDRFLSKTGFLWLDTFYDNNHVHHQGYNDDLTMDSGANWDIVKVYKEVNCLDFITNSVFCSLDLLWKRSDEPKEVTMAEVEAKFGCKVKIVNDK